MKLRSVGMIIFALIVAAFVALNWAELSRSTVLNLGVAQIQGPLGLVMLGLLLLASVLFMAYLATIQTSALMQAREYSKELKAQRELADRAEASRFTDLRALIERIEADSKTRHQQLHDQLHTQLGQLQQDLLARIDASSNGLAACVGELDDRLQRSAVLVADADIQHEPEHTSKPSLSLLRRSLRQLLGQDKTADSSSGDTPAHAPASQTDRIHNLPL